jgi:CDP-diglyceride synthetase
MALATSFTIGDFYMISTIIRAGPSEYQYLETEKELSSPYTFGKNIVQIIAFALMVYLWYIDHIFFVYMTWIGLILVVIIWLMTTAISTKERNFNISNNIMGYILVAIFFIANLVAFPGPNANELVRNISLIISGIIYLFVFFYALFHIDEIRSD